jgi:hypothetical protein
MSELTYACPVCQTPFKGTTTCAQCHADLTPLMTAIGRAFHLRCQARKALGQRQYQTSRRLATQAQRIHHTPRGESLLNVSAIAQTVCVNRDL